MTNGNGGDNRTLLYKVTSDHWAHAEQIRWTLLYNLLVANTLIALAWAAIFGIVPTRPLRPITLVAFSAAGLIVSVVWIFLADRANGFVAMYARSGEQAEANSVSSGPFQAAMEHRNQMYGIAKFVTTSKVVICLPILFVLLFGCLFVVSFMC